MDQALHRLLSVSLSLQQDANHGRHAMWTCLSYPPWNTRTPCAAQEIPLRIAPIPAVQPRATTVFLVCHSTCRGGVALNSVVWWPSRTSHRPGPPAPRSLPSSKVRCQDLPRHGRSGSPPPALPLALQTEGPGLPVAYVDSFGPCTEASLSPWSVRPCQVCAVSGGCGQANRQTV